MHQGIVLWISDSFSEVRYRSLTFYTSHLLGPSHSIRTSHLGSYTDARGAAGVVEESGDFVKVDIFKTMMPRLTFWATNMMLVTLRSDWEVASKMFK